MCGSNPRGVASSSGAPIDNLPLLEHHVARARCGAHGTETSMQTQLRGALVHASVPMCILQGELQKECRTRFT